MLPVPAERVCNIECGSFASPVFVTWPNGTSSHCCVQAFGIKQKAEYSLAMA